ncbi:LacI family DNA-binding transcriptional regulator [Hoyosella subflava]|uniref:Transcriptional regulator, LacI family n=1 Tax=Hoyosella subflava (strain DSM 45089 / JCM 17490 / NBRC 109087 / DQS3-9A1) TaxID=443218 RepID=F6EKM8_HOYSD|nr:LacI family DNA-binding transcriptional regulator [Hoyosella subflava]AEF40164.1 Transcriptional regulator, LacI family [Hoyosella subflava DQS3-9A1]
MAAKPRIKDVAERAGVSAATVSFVLNDVEGARVAPETRDRIRAAAKELGYRPNTVARGLRTQRTQMIGFISDEIATTPFAGQMIQGAHDAAHKAGYLLLMINTGQSADEQHLAAQALVQRQIDGAIVATMYHQMVEVPTELASTPRVVLDAKPQNDAVSYVVPDEAGGATAVMGELIAAGHHRIGHVTERNEPIAKGLRLQAYRESLRKNALPEDPALIEEDEANAHGGYRAVLRLLDSADPPTAVFCYNDRMAMGAYRAAAERGLKIPEDLSVAGYDNQQLISDALSPGLTTAALPHYHMGVWAVETLLATLSSTKPIEPQAHLMPCPLVRRHSIAPPRR